MLEKISRQKRRQNERRALKGPSPIPNYGPNRKARRQMARGKRNTMPFLSEKMIQENLERPDVFS